MMRSGKLNVVALTIAVLGMQAIAVAQDRVTVVRRNGDRVSGQFEDWNRGTDTVYVRASPSDQRQFPMRDVLVIDVGGSATNLPPNETQAAQGSAHVLVTRGGEIITGRLVNIEGGQGSANESIPRTVSFQAGGERRFPFSDVARIYMGNYPAPSPSNAGGAATPPPAQPPVQQPQLPESAIRVSANQRWTATNIVIANGDRVQFLSTGEVQLSADPGDRAGTAGSLRGRMAPNAPMPQILAGALIGRVGNGPPFAIGDQKGPLPMSGGGPLWLGVNDDELSDNSGQFGVTVRVTRGK